MSYALVQTHIRGVESRVLGFYVMVKLRSTLFSPEDNNYPCQSVVETENITVAPTYSGRLESKENVLIMSFPHYLEHFNTGVNGNGIQGNLSINRYLY